MSNVRWGHISGFCQTQFLGLPKKGRNHDICLLCDKSAYCINKMCPLTEQCAPYHGSRGMKIPQPGLGGPKGALKAPKISQNSGISDSVPSKPKWVEHWLNLVDHCISHSGGQFGSFGPIRNVNGRPQNGLKSALLAQMVLFGQRPSEQS